MQIKPFFDLETWTLTYVVYKGGQAIVIDPVLNFDPASGRSHTGSVDSVISFLRSERLDLKWILETHAHADHISGAPVLKKAFPQAKTGIGDRIREVQKIFAKQFNMQIKTDGSQFDHLFKDGEVVDRGLPLGFQVLSTPGHTPACVTYQFGDTLFTGDVMFMPDSGTGRCDFPGGSAETLYESIHEKIYKFKPETQIFVGHDYQPNGRELQFSTTVKAEMESNIHLKAATSQEEFVRFRKDRDATLSAPRLLLPSIQLNINAGHLPLPESNGVRYLKWPIFD